MEIEDFAAAYGLVKSLKGKLFKPEDYEELLNAQDLEDYFKFINPHLIQKNPPVLNELNFETILNFENIEVLRKLQVFLKPELKEFLEILKLKYFITRIEYVIYKIETSEIMIFNDYIDSLWCKYSMRPHAYAFHEFLPQIRNTKLKEIVSESYHSYKSGLGKDLLAFNVGLERRYFSYLFEFAERFDDENINIIRSIIGELTEIEVIIWMLRMRLIYNMSYEEIIPFVPHFNIFLKYKEFNDLISINNINEAYEILESSYYSKYFKQLKYPEKNIENISNEFKKKFESGILRFFRSKPFSLGPILSYYVLKRFEIFRLISIAEAIRNNYNLDNLKELIF